MKNQTALYQVIRDAVFDGVLRVICWTGSVSLVLTGICLLWLGHPTWAVGSLAAAVGMWVVRLAANDMLMEERERISEGLK